MSSQQSAQHWHPLRNRVLALAAMVQASHLVQGIARKGLADSAELECAIDSILASPGNETIHAGHDHIHHDDFRLHLLRGCDGLLTVACNHRVKTMPFKRLTEHMLFRR